MKDFLKRTLLQTSPILLFRMQHYKLHKKFGSHAYWANVRYPRTFNEHILASKLDDSLRILGKEVVDKFAAKQYVSDRVGGGLVIPTIGCYDDLPSLLTARFPGSHVIKPTHLSGQVIFKLGADQVLTVREQRIVSKWLDTNHYFRTGEPQYRDLEPRIIVEPFIETASGPPDDYKFFCWHGKPRLIQVDTSRFQGHRRNFFDVDWNPQDLQLRYPPSSQAISQPVVLPAMLEIAETLSAGFSFVRVDLYELRQEVLFGEMTFHPDSGNAPFGRFESDLELGRFFASAD